MMKYLFIFLLITFGSLYSESVSETEWKEEKKDFVYKPKAEEPEKESKQQKPSGENGGSKPAASNFKLPAFLANPNIMYGFILIVVAVVLVLLLRNVTIPQKLPKNEFEYTDENIEERLMETDIDRLIRLALENNNYQLAIRYTFLKTLKLLVVKNKLIWKKQYTNRDYIFQLYQTPYFDPFKSITLTYERKWYRDDSSTKDEYEIYKNNCNHIQGM